VDHHLSVVAANNKYSATSKKLHLPINVIP
jgi:hypothetical protein